MITITKDYSFSAEEFFDYLEHELIRTIKEARGNDMPVKIAKGTRYKTSNVESEILDYQYGKLYRARFKRNDLDMTVSYQTRNTKFGVQIILTETMNSYDAKKHGKFMNWYYKGQLKRNANKGLRSLTDAVKDYVAE